MHGTADCWETSTVEPSLMVQTCLQNGGFPPAKAAFMGKTYCPPSAPKKQYKDQVTVDILMYLPGPRIFTVTPMMAASMTAECGT